MDESDLPLIIPSAEKPRLSEVIDYEREIAPYSLTMIYAGLGSGKNTFAGYLMNGSPKYNLPKLTVLLITSRKAKVVETLSDEDLDISNGIGDKKTLKQIRRDILLAWTSTAVRLRMIPVAGATSFSAARHAPTPLQG